MKKLMITTVALAAALALNADGIVSSSVVGYSAKEQKNTKPTGIITFQWDSCNGDTVKLNGFIVPSNPGTAFDHGVDTTPCTWDWAIWIGQFVAVIQFREAEML